ncbi:MAG: hypothetical protein D6701_09950 [Gemmatimonadetes bacterium]|nr:MAG: hypothetical protein D6701_09950 [Gemmatimonadota bacterium]
MQSRRGVVARFVAWVVVPVGLSAAAGLWAWRDGTARLETSVHVAVAQTATRLLARDLAEARDSLLTHARALPLAPDAPETLRRAAGGDTLAGLGRGERGLQLSVVGPGPTPDSVLSATAPFLPGLFRALPAVAPYGVSLYLRGRRALTAGDAGPDALPDSLLALAAEAPVPLEGFGPAPSVLTAPPASGRPPAVALLTVPVERALRPASLLLPFVVLAMMGVLALTAAWTVSAADTPAAPRGPAGGPTFQRLLVVLVPVFAGLTFLGAEDRAWTGEALEATRMELSRSLGLLRAVGRVGSAELAAELSGRPAARIERGVLAESTLPDADERIAELRAPPANFTAFGRLDTPRGGFVYASVRTGPASALILFAPLDHPGHGPFRVRLLLAALLALAPAAVAAVRSLPRAGGDA